ncbi:hypothetical protein C1H46_015630 [Malus baccata]|uniref:Uncharacterized protein n=1 Tax=Malus baccata TaxID=106549 RepID=A0A540MIX4_MALBA|nr:hypothetical protein C1H46_015630 [Malus baccata]
MESSAAILPLSQLPSLFPLKPNRSKLPYNRSWLSNPKPRASRPPRMHCHKMYVPGGYFSKCLFAYTYIFVDKKLVNYNGDVRHPCRHPSQSRTFNSHDRFGEPSPEAKAANNLHSFFTYVAVRIVCAQLESYNTEAYEELMEFLSRNSLNDGDQFCANLMRESSRHKGLALRILEMVDESNTRLMRDYVREISHVEGDRESEN